MSFSPSKKKLVYSKMGQRKLLLMEVKFLTKYGHLAQTVIYAGAAPGRHIPFLAELFQNHTFHLYDPREFHIDNVDHPRIHTHQELFTNEHSSSSGTDILFISDIRRSVEDKTREEIDNIIVGDMQMQMKWTISMQPRACMLKYRLPSTFTPDDIDFPYLEGEVWEQPWAPLVTYESRLVATAPYQLSHHNKEEYMENMKTWSQIRHKERQHKIPLKRCPGLCYCEECNREITIWKEYGAKSNTDISNLIRRCSTRTSPLGRHKRWKYATPNSWIPVSE